MWIDAHGVAHSVGMVTDNHGLEEQLQKRIVEATTPELRQVSLALMDFPETVFDELSAFATSAEVEDMFVDMELPTSERLVDVPDERYLLSVVETQLRAASLRWRLELCFSAIAAVGDELDTR